MLSCSSTITFIIPGHITITFNIHINDPHRDLIPRGRFPQIQKLNLHETQHHKEHPIVARKSLKFDLTSSEGPQKANRKFFIKV